MFVCLFVFDFPPSYLISLKHLVLWQYARSIYLLHRRSTGVNVHYADPWCVSLPCFCHQAETRPLRHQMAVVDVAMTYRSKRCKVAESWTLSIALNSDSVLSYKSRLNARMPWKQLLVQRASHWIPPCIPSWECWMKSITRANTTMAWMCWNPYGLLPSKPWGCRRTDTVFAFQTS